VRFPSACSAIESDAAILRAPRPRSTAALLHLRLQRSDPLLRSGTVLIHLRREVQPCRRETGVGRRKELDGADGGFSGAAGGGAVVEDGEVVGDGVAVGAGVIGVGSIDDGWTEASGALHLSDGERRRVVVVGGGIGVEVKIQHRGESLLESVKEAFGGKVKLVRSGGRGLNLLRSRLHITVK